MAEQPTENTPPQADPTENDTQPEQLDQGGGIAETLFSDQSGESSDHTIDAVYDVHLDVQIVLGRSRMPIAQLLNLSQGSVIEFDKRIGEAVDVMINNEVVARGDMVKVGDNRIGVTLTKIVRKVGRGT